MRDTVELLEQIGRNASLRRASPEVLARVLESSDASPGLREFVVRGSSEALTAELGLGGDRYVEHHSQTGAYEDTLLS
jgi:hypothetical protein